MGRMFWKIFLGFWLTLLVMGGGAGIAVYLHNRIGADAAELATGRRAEFEVTLVANALRYGGEAGARALLADWPGPHRPPVVAVDAEEVELLGRPVPRGAVARARADLARESAAPNLRQVTTPDGRPWLLFVPAGGRPDRDPRHLLPPDQQVALAVVASLLFAAGFAWYLTRPIRHLRAASRRLAEGALDTRVGPLMKGRRDELGELGRDFDFMAGRLQCLVGAQRQLLHDLSHELRSPLARLRLAVGLAQQQPEKLALSLGRMEHEVERLDELIGDILTLSRLEVGIHDGRRAELDLAELLAGIAEDARFESQAANREVRLEAPSVLPLTGQEELLHRAFENVVRNAVRFTAEGTAVEITAREPEAGWVTVVVCDRGPGIPESELTEVFRPFYRLDQGGSGHGFGLGLAIARRAVEAHGGSIAGHGRSGGGLCVAIRLPAGEPAAGR